MKFRGWWIEDGRRKSFQFASDGQDVLTTFTTFSPLCRDCSWQMSKECRSTYECFSINYRNRWNKLYLCAAAMNVIILENGWVNKRCASVNLVGWVAQIVDMFPSLTRGEDMRIPRNSKLPPITFFFAWTRSTSIPLYIRRNIHNKAFLYFSKQFVNISSIKQLALWVVRRQRWISLKTGAKNAMRESWGWWGGRLEGETGKWERGEKPEGKGARVGVGHIFTLHQNCPPNGSLKIALQG